jgi:hypothetical protein
MNFFYSPKFLADMSQKEVNFITLHEDFHLLFNHPKRTITGQYDHKMSNIAQDMIINHVIWEDIPHAFVEIPKNKDGKNLSNPLTAFAAKEFLRVYSVRLAAEMNDVRSAITNKLMELANCGDPRFELKALELLGKHSDIALFTERSEVTVTYKSSNDLEEAIKERVKRLLNSNTVDAEPAILVNSLDDQLGKATYTPSKMIDEISDVKASDAR